MGKVIVKDSDLIKAASVGTDEFLQVFINSINDAIGGELTSESMSTLNSDQITLLAWNILHEEVMDGGFVQLIHNGYGPFFFKNPFAKAIKLWGMRDLSKLVYNVHTLYVKYGSEYLLDTQRLPSEKRKINTKFQTQRQNKFVDEEPFYEQKRTKSELPSSGKFKKLF